MTTFSTSPVHLDLTVAQARKVFLAGCRVYDTARGFYATVGNTTKTHGVTKVSASSFYVTARLDDGTVVDIDDEDIALVPYNVDTDGPLYKGDKVVMLVDPYAPFKGAGAEVGKVFTVNRSTGSFISARGLGRAHMTRGSSGALFFAVVKLGEVAFITRGGWTKTATGKKVFVTQDRGPTTPSPWARTFARKPVAGPSAPSPAAPGPSPVSTPSAPSAPSKTTGRASAAPPVATKPTSTADSSSDWFASLSI